MDYDALYKEDGVVISVYKRMADIIAFTLMPMC